MSERVVVVGGSVGALTVAETLRQESFEGEVILVGEEAHLPYNRPPLSKQILAGDWDADQALIRTRSQLDNLGIDVRLGCTATGLDVGTRTLHTAHGDLPFDELVIATGTEPNRHPALPTALTLRTLDDALVLRSHFERADSIAVVGSGVLGATSDASVDSLLRSPNRNRTSAWVRCCVRAGKPSATAKSAPRSSKS